MKNVMFIGVLAYLLILAVSFSCTEASSNQMACDDYPEGCPEGMVCHEGFCMTRSDASDALCQDINCGENARCYFGSCFDVYVEPETDPCAGIDCGEEMACYQGSCFPFADAEEDPCDGIVCHEGQVCYLGTCFAEANHEQDPCEGIVCREGFVCYYGSCVQEQLDEPQPDERSCENVICPPGQSCVNGNCRPQISDPVIQPDACFPIACPFGRVCVDGRCVPLDERWLEAVDLKNRRFLMEGLVLDALGQPVSGAKIFVQNKEIPLRTDTKGRFAIPILANQDVKFALTGHQDIQLKAHPDVRNLEVQFRVMK